MPSHRATPDPAGLPSAEATQSDTAAHHTPHAPHTPWPKSAILGVILSIAVSIVVLAFSWPAVTAEPKDLPVAISGPSQIVDQVKTGIEGQSEGALKLQEVSDREAAINQIEQREAYGAIILGEKPEVLTSSAASTVTNQMLTQLRGTLEQNLQQAAAVQAQAAGVPAPTVTVELTDVVPLVEDDPRGAAFTAASFPLVIGGLIGGIGITFAVAGAWRRAVALLVYASVAGVAIAGIMQGWFHVLGGNYFAIAGTFALTLLAMGTVIVGFASIFGRAGISIGPVLFMLIGNPISAATFPREFYPAPWGDIGQYLPPGAGVTLLRDASYFPDANLAGPILTLVAWAVGGLILVVIGHYRDQGRFAIEENPEDAAATHAVTNGPSRSAPNAAV